MNQKLEPTPEQPSRWRDNSWLFCVFLLAATFLAYQPVWHAGFIWDDDQYVTGNTTLHTLDGLRQIWLVPGATVQYYPLTFTTFWLEYHLWGLHSLGYHLVNVLLHAINAILFGLLLRRLKVPGAWLAAGIFALHPVCVESVAWVTERKNTLSGLFYLSSLLMVVKFWLPKETTNQSKLKPATGELGKISNNWKFYWLALVLCVCAVSSKTTAIPLPVVILILVWWKRGWIAWREAYLALPFLIFGVAMGLITMHVENHLGATGNGWNLSLLERCLIAGKDFWFYLGKLFWPHPLIYVYPRWELNSSSLMAYLPIVMMIATFLILWFKRSILGRGIFAGMAYFVVLLSLVLGFFNVFYFRYSFVSDHFQYLASLGPLALAAAGLTIILNKANQFLKITVSLLLLLTLGTLTWRQCGDYANSETLWRATIAKNPQCWMAHNNLGHILLDQKHPDEALNHLQVAEELHPDDATVQNNLGSAWLQKGNQPEAYARFQKALAIKPDYAVADNNLGDFFLKQGQADKAMPYLRKALAIQPDMADANYNLGNAFLQKGDLNAAIQQWQKTLVIQPDYMAALNNLGNAFLNNGQISNAIGYFEKAVKADPNSAEAENNLGTAFIENEEATQAIPCLRQALKNQPDFVPAQNNLAWVLATCPKPELRNGVEALELAQSADRLAGNHNPLILRTLAAAYAENGQFTNAVKVVHQALKLLPPDDGLAANLEEQLQLYESGLPFREKSSINPH
jgi:protein O-mannosyl-transferase